MSKFIKNKAVKLIAQNSKTTDTLTLTYTILNTDISRRWIELVNRNNELNHSLRFNYRRNLNDEEIREQFEEFKDAILSINQNYDRQLTELESFDHLRENQHILNDLHEEYEIYGDRLAYLIENNYFDNPLTHVLYNEIWPGVTHNKVIHELFLRLNEQIHNFEAIYRTENNSKKSICTCLIDFMPAGLHEPLKPEDYFLFSSERYWGWGYLGYNTLGKHWNSACWDNDVEVVRRHQIRPQARFAAEYYLNFSPANQYDSSVSFYNWWIKNNFSDIKDPRLKLEDFALGFIPITKIYSYSINSQKEFIFPESFDGEEWNVNVWSRFDSIIDFRIVNV